MAKKKFQVREVARLSKVTVRTLHHYEAVGLLVPSGRSRSGYRLYDEADLLRLQQILIHRELGFPLKEIKALLDAEGVDRRAALAEQRAQLVERAGEVSRMIEAVDLALAALDGGSVDLARLFDGFDPALYEAEVEERWGDTDAYQEANARTAQYSKADWQALHEEQDAIMKSMAGLLGDGAEPTSAEAMAVAERHRAHIERWFYPCDHSTHAALADMYEADPRFAESFERHASGLCAFFCAAIRANAARDEP